MTTIPQPGAPRHLTDVIINELSSVYHGVRFGLPKCGAQFPRRFLSENQAVLQGFRPCRLCYRTAVQP